MNLKDKIENKLKKQGVDFVHCLDISDLPEQQRSVYSNAILFGIALTPAYIQEVRTTSQYVKKMIQSGEIQYDEFHLTELKTDRLADELAFFIEESGNKAQSQSEKNLEKIGNYNQENRSTSLPHKILAGRAGMGWIGKNNLLVTMQFGCAISMCAVLTNASLPTIKSEVLQSKCGTCNRCVEVCDASALTGRNWDCSTQRDDIIDVFRCSTCIECMMVCPWTLNYMNRNLK